MTWKKIDDAQALPDMPYSSFLANGLTTNSNSYNNDMTRGGGIAWNSHDPVTWSSYWEPRGFVFTVNVGQSVKQVDFRVSYGTLTNSVDADGFQGYVSIYRWAGREFVTVGVPPSSPGTAYLDISLPLNAAATGPQTFGLTFQSSILEDLGIVKVRGGVQNTVYLDQHAGPGSYPITAGEKHEILDLTGVTSPSPGETNTLNLYQINAISKDAPHPPDGYASVYPQLVSDPPRLVANYDAPKNSEAHVFELGAITLRGVAFNSVDANPSTAPAQLSHNTAGQLDAVIRNQNESRILFQPDLCNGVSQRYAFGAVIASASTSPVNAAVDTSFSFVSNTVVDNLTLSVTLRYFGLISGLNPKLVFSLKDETGALVTSNIETPITVSRLTWPQSVIGITARGWYDPTAVAAWGMRDSMEALEMLSANMVAINVPQLTLLPNKVYTVELSVSPENTAIYVFNLYSRLVYNAG